MLLPPIAVMRCVPLFTREAYITCKANITSAGQHHVPLKRNTSFKKAPFVRQTKDAFLLAEKERFELSNGLWPLRDFQSRALDQTRRLLHISLTGLPAASSGRWSISAVHQQNAEYHKSMQVSILFFHIWLTALHRFSAACRVSVSFLLLLDIPAKIVL